MITNGAPQRRRAAATVVAAATLALTLAACGGAEEDTAEAAASASAGGDTTVATAFGDVTVPAEPERVITLAESALDVALGVGITPVGTVASRGGTAPPEYLGTDAASIPVVGTVREFNLEAVLETEPDLILAAAGLPQEQYDAMTAIAPTVVPEAPATGEWEKPLHTYAEALGKDDELTERLDAVQARARELADSGAAPARSPRSRSWTTSRPRSADRTSASGRQCDPLRSPAAPTPRNPMTATLLLVHGAWHTSWCWQPLIDELPDVDVVTVQLPSSGTDPNALGDLTADADAVRAALAGIEGPVVVVGHSYGGIPITEAATAEAGVVHLVYLCAFQLDVGESLVSSLGGEVPPWQEIHPTHVRVTTPEAVFYNGVDPRLTEQAVAQLRVHSTSALTQPLSRAAWTELPSTYVVCEQDQAIPVFAQEAMSARAGTVLRLDSGHSPFLSQPAELAALLRKVLDQVR